MNQEQLKASLKTSGISRDNLAEMVGCHVKTTYWKALPEYVVTILRLLERRKHYKQLQDSLIAIVNEDMPGYQNKNRTSPLNPVGQI